MHGTCTYRGRDCCSKRFLVKFKCPKSAASRVNNNVWDEAEPAVAVCTRGVNMQKALYAFMWIQKEEKKGVKDKKNKREDTGVSCTYMCLQGACLRALRLL